MDKLNSIISGTLENIRKAGDKIEKYGYQTTGKEKGRKYIPSQALVIVGSKICNVMEKAQTSWSHTHPQHLANNDQNDASSPLVPHVSLEIGTPKEEVAAAKTDLASSHSGVFGPSPEEDYDELLTKLDNVFLGTSLMEDLETRLEIAYLAGTQDNLNSMEALEEKLNKAAWDNANEKLMQGVRKFKFEPVEKSRSEHPSPETIPGHSVDPDYQEKLAEQRSKFAAFEDLFRQMQEEQNEEKKLSAGKTKFVTAQPSNKEKSAQGISEGADQDIIREKESKEAVEQPRDRQAINEEFAKIKHLIDNLGDKKFRFSETDEQFVAKERKTGLHRTWRHKRSDNTMEKLISQIRAAIDLGMTEVVDKNGNAFQIKNLISSIQRSKWGKETLERNPQFAERLNSYKTTIQIEFAKEQIEFAKEQMSKLAKADSDSYRQQKLLAGMALYGEGDAEILANHGIATPEMLLLTYPIIMTSGQLFSEITNVLKSSVDQSVKLNLIKFTSQWLTSGLYKSDLPEVQKQLAEIQVYCKQQPGLENVSEQIEKALEKQPSVESPTSNKVEERVVEEWMQQCRVVEEWMQQCMATSRGISEFSRALMKSEADNLHKISLKDLLKYEENQQQGKVQDAIAWSTNISTLVSDQILNSDDVTNSQKVYTFFLKTAGECLKNKNYNSAMAIYLGLNNGAVLRMKLNERSNKKLLNAELKKLDELFLGEGNYTQLRSLYAENLGKPMIPFLGNLTKDITFLRENPKLIEEGYNTNMLNLYTKPVHILLASKDATAQIIQNPTHAESTFKEYAETYITTKYPPKDFDFHAIQKEQYDRSLELVPRLK